MLPIYLIKRILQEFLSSIDDHYRLLDLLNSIQKFALVCKQWRLSVVPLLSFETPMDSHQKINKLFNINFRNFNVESSVHYYQVEKISKEEEKKKLLDELKAFRDNTTIVKINVSDFIHQENINDYIDSRRLKKLTLFKNFFFMAEIAGAYLKTEEYLSNNLFPELRDLVLEHFGTIPVNWSFPTMPQLESLDISFTKLSGEALDIIFSRFKVIKMSDIDPLLALSHLERSTVVCHFTTKAPQLSPMGNIFQYLARLLNSNSTLKSLKIKCAECVVYEFQLTIPSIHNTTLENLKILYDSDHDKWRDSFSTLCSKWTDSNLKTFVTPNLFDSTFTSDLAHQIQSSFPKLENLFYNGGDIDAFERYILSNHNLKTLTFGTKSLNSSIIGCLHSIRDLTFDDLNFDSLIQILSMQSPVLKSLKVKNPLDSPSLPQNRESLALSIRDNQHLTHLSFVTPTQVFSSESHLVKFLTSIIEGNQSLLSLKIGFTMGKAHPLERAKPLDPTQFSLFKQSILNNHTIQTLKISRFINLKKANLEPTMGPLLNFIRSQSIRTNL